LKREQKMALRRIRKLLELAFSERREELARRYVELSRRIASRLRVRLPRDRKRWICKKCNSPLIPGRNAVVRVERGIIKIICLECGNVRRFPYK